MVAESFHMNQFNSIGAAVAASEAGSATGGASHNKRDHWGEDWYGTDSFAQAADWAKYGGWEPEDMQQFRDAFGELEPKLRQFVADQLERGIDTNGFEVNMQAFMDGDPDHMWQWQPNEQVLTKKALCLLVGHSIVSHVSAEDLFVRGQALIALVRSLSLLGFELEIWSEATGGNWGRTETKLSVLTRLHAAGEIMDESAIEFAVGNPSWFRRIIFGIYEGQPSKVRKEFGIYPEGTGYTRPLGLHHAELVGADLQVNLGETWFPTNSAKGGMQWVVDQLRALGVISQDATVEWD